MLQQAVVLKCNVAGTTSMDRTTVNLIKDFKHIMLHYVTLSMDFKHIMPFSHQELIHQDFFF